MGLHNMYQYLHGRYLQLVQHNDWRNLALFMPRGYFKSSMMTVGYTVWDIINNPNIRIALADTNETLGKKFLGQVERIIKSDANVILITDVKGDNFNYYLFYYSLFLSLP